MKETTVRITNRMGLHARAAAKLVRLAGTFQSVIRLQRPDNSASADAKSILGILLLAAARIGTELIVTTEGVDEDAAMNAIVQIFATGFGEN
jgi:phosphocarrier protein HPr